ncbi:PspC domain-containing protein [Propionimicrobium sp. PCR01-08-3]|uniref:PspC domain-containing protein n=1 Tax=Propionimicrobium sp. PCR01-08-3 TaxID=3052086 RepID=UPI00255CDA47|nr:PspC domain-containing protein [Propionimicrobium sp. PCR01-08-3]WIY83263.1 PspC domain-containing protein [Propionimicrobium sp. PCR01-08-3]
MSTRKLVRSRDHRVIAGVCGGIAEYFDIDPTIIRVVTVALGLFSVGTVCAAYAVAWLAIPDEGSGQTGADQIHERYGDYQRRRDARLSDDPDGPSDAFRADD